ncbi:MAG: FGGY family carbohydrate kinase [Candidatus Acidiferrum sp.]
MPQTGAIATVASAQEEHEQIYPSPGWVEHDPEEIWRRTQDVIRKAMQQKILQAKDLAAIGITNQRETVILWEKTNGRPVCNAIVWQDTRVKGTVAEFAKQGSIDRFRAKTGLPLSTYFSALKIRWILQNVRNARKLADDGELLCGTMDAAGLAVGYYSDLHDFRENWKADQTGSLRWRDPNVTPITANGRRRSHAPSIGWNELRLCLP